MANRSQTVLLKMYIADLSFRKGLTVIKRARGQTRTLMTHTAFAPNTDTGYGDEDDKYPRIPINQLKYYQLFQS
jgi:hypothetical protein